MKMTSTLIVNPPHPPCFHSSVSVIYMVSEWDICITSISTPFNLPPSLPLSLDCGVILFRIFLINKLVVDDRDDGDDIH